jgi:hypothetical protein
MPPPLDMPPLVDPEAPLDVEPDSPPLDPDTPPDVDPDSPPLDPEPLVEVDPAPPLDPDPLVDASSVFPEPGIRGAMPSSSWLRDPHPMASKTAMVEIVLIGFMDGVAAAAVAGERSLPV